jgi:hypothetical protein
MKKMTKMLDFKLLLICIFGFISLTIGLTAYTKYNSSNSNNRISCYNACHRICPSCSISYCSKFCSEYAIELDFDENENKRYYIVGVVFMIFGGSVFILSCPVLARRLATKPRTNLTKAQTQLERSANIQIQTNETPKNLGREVEEKDIESANLQKQLNAQSTQIKLITERLSQMEKKQQLPQETLTQEVIEIHPLGGEAKSITE